MNSVTSYLVLITFSLWLLLFSSSVLAEAPTDEELKALEQQIEQQEMEQAEAKRKAAEEIKRKAEEEAKRLAEEEAKKKEEEMRTPGKVFRDKLKDGSDGPEMVVIPAGSFQMGDLTGDGGSEEKPVHTVTFAKLFAMGKYEVAFEDYDKFASATSRQLLSDEGWGRDKQPVIYVSWDDAVTYAQWLSEQTGKKYRLPSEAEWEYAARAGSTTKYPWGNDIGSSHANCYGCGSQWDEKQTAPVGSFAANAFGLFDTAGNVWEWTQDCWNENFNGAPADGAAWQSGDCGRRVERGGSWNNLPDWLRSASRHWNSTDYRYSTLGFRLVQDLE